MKAQAMPGVAAHAAVMRFRHARVIAGGDLVRALRHTGSDAGPPLVIARDLTVEAQAADGRDVLTERESGWTDAAVSDLRSRGSPGGLQPGVDIGRLM